MPKTNIYKDFFLKELERKPGTPKQLLHIGRYMSTNTYSSKLHNGNILKQGFTVQRKYSETQSLPSNKVMYHYSIYITTETYNIEQTLQIDFRTGNCNG